MKRNGVFFCRWCGYHCPVKAPVTPSQLEAGMLDHLFWEITLPPIRGQSGCS